MSGFIRRLYDIGSRATVGNGGNGGSVPPRVRTLRYRNSRSRRRNSVRRRRRRTAPRRNRRNNKSYLSPSAHAKRGVVLMYETSGITGGTGDDSEVAYIGHTNAPIANVMSMAVRSIIKSAFARIGVHFRSFDDQIGFAGTLRLSYYASPTSTTLVNIDYAYTAPNTFNNATGSILNPYLTAMASTPDLKPYSFSILPTSGIPRVFYLDSSKMTISLMSRLKIQNRTPTAAGEATVDANNINFLVGQQYWGNGTGTYVKSPNLGTPHQPLIGDAQAGLIVQARADNFATPNQWMRHPPETTKLFTHVKKRVPVTKFTPGATKYSYLKTTRTLSFVQLTDMFLKDAQNSYMLSTLGKFSIFGFQKYIDDDIAVKISLAYETEFHVGITTSLSSNIHTVPVLFEV